MIPPLVRLGYPTEPQPSLQYLLLVRDIGWVMAEWRPQQGFVEEDVLYPGSNGLVSIRFFHPEDILCWMPQDGS